MIPNDRTILGRDTELDQLRRYLEAVYAAPSVFVFEGVAGIGKTTLWLGAVEAARAMGLRPTITRSAETEARLSYAALGDLLGDCLGEALPGLPVPQRQALEAALLRSSEGDPAPDPRAISLAALGVIKNVAATGPLVMAIDDVQWLDLPSARVLSFVLRRLVDEPVGLVCSMRLGPGSRGEPIGLDRLTQPVTRVHVGPLAIDPLGRLLRERSGVDLPRPVIRKLHDVSRGNPLFALEIARAMVRRGVRPDPGGPLPVPEDLQELLSSRLATLPPSARAPLLAAAAAFQPSVELVLSASTPAGSTSGSARSGLAHAEAAGIVERADGRVRFTHPLLASTVYLNASPRERQDVHRRLAELVGDPEERARHLALAADIADAKVADALEEAARHARSRGAPDAAAELIELARARTPADDGDARRRRSVDAAAYHFDAGDASRAVQVLRDSATSLPPGPARADILFRLASVSWMNLIRGVREPAEQAAREAGPEPELQCGAHWTLAWVAFYLGDVGTASQHARLALDYAGRLDAPGFRADALSTFAVMEFVQGRAADALMTEAIELQDLMMRDGSWTDVAAYTTPRSIRGLELMWSGKLDEARAAFERELADYETHAMYTVRQEVLCYLAELECRAGRWNVATRLAAEAMETLVEAGKSATMRHLALFNQALAAAHLGQVDQARSWASEGLRLALANDDLFNACWNRAVLGFLELSLGNVEQAHATLEPAVRYLERMGAAEPAIIPCLPDDVEALVALGRTHEAERLTHWLGERARTLDRPWGLATAARCRGLLAAARGDVEGAWRELEAALREHDRMSQPFERARSLLVLGRIQRRARQKTLARSTLTEARDGFAALGAPLWEQHARSELARIGGRPPNRDALTPTEREVARLVADGRTNREVASALFMSLGTVQANLKRIYSKLDVRSRTELAARGRTSDLGDQLFAD